MANGNKANEDKRQIVSDLVEDRASAFEAATRERIDQRILEINVRLTQMGHQFRARLILIMAIATVMLVATGVVVGILVHRVNVRLDEVANALAQAETVKAQVDVQLAKVTNLTSSVQSSLKDASTLRTQIKDGVDAVNQLKSATDAKTKELESSLSQAQALASNAEKDVQGSKDAAARLVSELEDIKTWSNSTKDTITKLQDYLVATAGDFSQLAAAYATKQNDEVQRIAKQIQNRPLPKAGP